MSVNSPSSSNDTLLHPNISSNNHNLPLDMYCLTSRPGSIIFTSFFITAIFLVFPLLIFVIYHGLQQWRQNNSTSSTVTMSHSDCFTYHMVTMELIGVFGCVLCCCGIYSDHLNILSVSLFLLNFTWIGQVLFHFLTCVERYLAVVHPITYLSLRNERGIRIRNISIGCVWLLSVVGVILLMIEDVYIIVNFCLVILSLSAISFCSLSVLCVLIRPGPGEQGGSRQKVDQSKQRAFYTIMVILGVLLVKFSWNLVWAVLFVSGQSINCVVMTAGPWFNLPSVLVLPLLFLLRARKLVCCKNNTKKGEISIHEDTQNNRKI